MQLYDSELIIMEILWEHNKISAKEIAIIAKEKIQWSRTTTYTVIKRMIQKGLIQKIEPRFVCLPLINKQEVQQYETQELINKMYDGCTDKLVATLINTQNLSEKEIIRLKELIANL